MEVPLFYKGIDMKKPTRIPKKELLDFLEPEIQDFVYDVTDFTKKKWLKTYDKDILKNTIEDAFEWCHGNERKKNIGSTIATFLRDKPKRLQDDVVESMRLLKQEVIGDS